MMLIQIVIVLISNLEFSEGVSSTGICQGKMQMVKSKNIGEERLVTRVGITNGEPFLADYLNQTRFALDAHVNCAIACFR